MNMRWLHYSTLLLFGEGLFKRKEGTGFMTNTVIDREKLPGPQIGAIILGISQVQDTVMRGHSAIRRERQKIVKRALVIHLATLTAQ